MISEDQYLAEVSKTKADISQFCEIAVNNFRFRNMVVNQLLNNEKINVYFHSYCIINKVVKENPDNFIEYWDSFVSLLNHENSYHRNYAMEILSYLVSEDNNYRFKLIFNDFYKQLYDNKVSTRKYCICHSVNIIQQIPELANRIISEIIKSLRINSNTEKHQNFLLAEFLGMLIGVKEISVQNKEVREFLLMAREEMRSVKLKKTIDNYFAVPDN